MENDSLSGLINVKIWEWKFSGQDFPNSNTKTPNITVIFCFCKFEQLKVLQYFFFSHENDWCFAFLFDLKKKIFYVLVENSFLDKDSGAIHLYGPLKNLVSLTVLL